MVETLTNKHETKENTTDEENKHLIKNLSHEAGKEDENKEIIEDTLAKRLNIKICRNGNNNCVIQDLKQEDKENCANTHNVVKLELLKKDMEINYELNSIESVIDNKNNLINYSLRKQTTQEILVDKGEYMMVQNGVNGINIDKHEQGGFSADINTEDSIKKNRNNFNEKEKDKYHNLHEGNRDIKTISIQITEYSSYEKEENLFLVSLQGEINNIDMMECEFNKERIELVFTNFILKGRKVEEEYTMFEKIDGKVYMKKHFDYLYLFDKGPRFVINKKLIK